ncbi:unnamed protein product [Linum tenue]|uniref:TPX2 C-terminal domain-containing protein n=1 Tax=Linum tenue TaxID=586396 RepID=A0AAV0MRR7_9ROSI|nr:unnamed protein product [Linum tenue]
MELEMDWMGRKLVNADMDERRNGVVRKSNSMSQGGGARVSARSTSADQSQGKKGEELEVIKNQEVLGVKNTNDGIVTPISEQKSQKPRSQKSIDGTKTTSLTLNWGGPGNSEAAHLQPAPLMTEKHEDVNSSANAYDVLSPISGKISKHSSPKSVRKVFQHDGMHLDEDDKCSATSPYCLYSLAMSRTAASVRTIKSITVGTAPTFKSAERAQRRKEFYTKLEEKQKALEAEKNQAEARTKEEQQAAIKQMRKNMIFRANPVPNFYYEPPPPKVELKKLPLTRPVSPKLNRRKSCGDATVNTYQEQQQVNKHCVTQRHSLGNHAHKESTSGARARTRTSSSGQATNGSSHNNKANSHSGSEQHHVITTSTTTTTNATQHMAGEQPSANISVES